MKKLFIVVILVTLGLFSCTKEDPQPNQLQLEEYEYRDVDQFRE